MAVTGSMLDRARRVQHHSRDRCACLLLRHSSAQPLFRNVHPEGGEPGQDRLYDTSERDPADVTPPDRRDPSIEGPSLDFVQTVKR
jgi:hypothetical protein